MNRFLFAALGAGALACALPAHAQGVQEVRGLSATQLFEMAASAEAQGDSEAAITLYRALAKDPALQVRAEARFRNGQLMARQGKFADAALLYRAILDEQPEAQRVRLELAAVLAQMGDMRGAGRAMRQAQAGGLPADVAQLVSQFQGALRSFRPYGGSLEVSLAPSSNVNRATNATTLDTIIAPFELSEDARAQSGVGAKLAGQGYLHLPLGKRLRMTTRLSGQGNFYRQNQFNDLAASGETGLELSRGKSLFRSLIGRSVRWYGGDLYATTNTATLDWQRSIGKRSQLEISTGLGWTNYRQNDLQDGQIYDASISLEHAFNAKSGARLSLTGQRQTARDAGYATASGGVAALFYREMGGMTVYGSLGLSRLEADARLTLFPRRRTEWLTRASVGATLRRFKVAGFAPVVRVNYERNASRVALYDFKRFGAEMGVTRAF